MHLAVVTVAPLMPGVCLSSCNKALRKQRDLVRAQLEPNYHSYVPNNPTP